MSENMTLKTKELPYGRYTIRTLEVGGKVKARALLGSVRVADAEGDTHDAAADNMKFKLDQMNERTRSARKAGVPSADEFAEAFTHLISKIGRHHWLMLKAHIEAPNRILTASELAAAAGYRNYSSANEKFGMLGKMLAENLDYQPDRRADGSTIWTSTIATGVDPDGSRDDGQWQWRMRDEVASALVLINLAARLDAASGRRSER